MNNSLLATSTSNAISGYSGNTTTTIATPYGIGSAYAVGTTSLGYLQINSNQMKQVKVALFSITKDRKTNEITDTKFMEEFWVKQDPGVSLDAAAMFQLGRVIDPKKEVIKELFTLYF
jgi:hypothetical protein